MLGPGRRKHDQYHRLSPGVVDSLGVADYLRMNSGSPAARLAAHNILPTLEYSDYPACMDRVLPEDIHGRQRERRREKLLVVLERPGRHLLLVSGWDVRKGVLIDMLEMGPDYRVGTASSTDGKLYCNNHWQP